MTPYYADDAVTIYHGDCREILPTLAADVLVTDPPYGMRMRRTHGGSWHGTTVDGDSDTGLRDEVLEAWTGPAIVFGTWKAPRPNRVREVLVWDKVISTGLGDLGIPWRPSWEEIYVIGEGFSGRRSHGVLRYGIPTLAQERRDHPTPKPVLLMRELIGKCPPGVILDPFAGSGSTLVAAKSLGRKAIGIEIDGDYCATAARRCASTIGVQEVLGLDVA